MASWEYRELREARQDAARAEDEWRLHRHGCVTCAIASRTRKLAEACPGGVRLVAWRNAARAALDAERKRSKEPDPAQAALFTAGECALPP